MIAKINIIKLLDLKRLKIFFAKKEVDFAKNVVMKTIAFFKSTIYLKEVKEVQMN